ncbi:MAG: class I SAM-dependent methyltransferase [Candidatus Dormibacteria bacterium]
MSSLPEGIEVSTIARLSAAGCVMPSEEVAAALAEWPAMEAGEKVRRLDDYAARRERGEPPAYILGGVRFLDGWVKVGPGAFVPRPWTEAVARVALDLLPPGGTVVDLGTGAGAIATAIARAATSSQVWATEVDAGALRWARRNLDAHPNSTLLAGDLFQPLPPSLRDGVDVVVGCLPYVPTASLATLPADFLAHEPAIAFDGGEDGLALVRRAIDDGRKWLRGGAWMVLEIGAGQGDPATRFARELGYREVQVRLDGDGDEAMVVGRR